VTYVFDLDGTLCTTTLNDYAAAEPFMDRIAVLRDLHDAGHRIVVDTARGSGTGEDWRAVTIRQLLEWGVPFHELRVGKKMVGDLYVDDKGVRADEFFSEA
jgi:hypothetical protein